MAKPKKISCSVKAANAARAKGGAALARFVAACGPVDRVRGSRGSRKSRGSRGSTSTSDVRSPTSTSTEVRSPTSTSTEVRSPTSTSTSTEAYTSGNITVTGGAGEGDTTVHVYPCRTANNDEAELWTKRQRPPTRKLATDRQELPGRPHYSSLEALSPRAKRGTKRSGD